jgi:hypothetical protein
VSEAGKAELIEPLVTHGADLEARARRWFERTPLHLAAQTLSLDAVRVLLNLGASVETTDEHDCTALHLAVSMCSEHNGNKAAPVVALLLSFGSDPERRAHVHFTAEDSETVLDIASRKGCPEVTDVLSTWLASKRRAEQDAAQMGIKQFLQSSEYSDVTFILTPDACKVGGSTRDCVPAAVPDHMDKQRRSEGGVRRGKKRVAAGGKAVNSKQLRIPAHKVLLASESPVFHAMFHHPFQEKRTNTVRYCELEKDVLDHLLAYVYKKTIEDSPDRLVKLLEVADKLQMAKLKWDCEVLLMRYLDAEDAEDALILGNRYGASTLAKVAQILTQPAVNEDEAAEVPGVGNQQAAEESSHGGQHVTPVEGGVGNNEDVNAGDFNAAIVDDEASSADHQLLPDEV